MSFSADGQRLLTHSLDNAIRLIDIESRAQIGAIPTTSGTRVASLRPDGEVTPRRRWNSRRDLDLEPTPTTSLRPPAASPGAASPPTSATPTWQPSTRAATQPADPTSQGDPTMVFIVITGVFVVLFSGIVLAVQGFVGRDPDPGIRFVDGDGHLLSGTDPDHRGIAHAAERHPLGSRWSDWRWRPSPSSSPQPGSGSPAHHAPNALRRWRASTRQRHHRRVGSRSEPKRRPGQV